MTFKLVFIEQALKEWKNLDNSVQAIFKKKLAEVLENPRVEANRISGTKDGYKIKLRRVGFRLVYTVEDNKLVVTVIAVGKRERNQVYKNALKRI